MSLIPQDALAAVEEAMAEGAETHDPPDSWERETVGEHLRHLALHLVDFARGIEPETNIRNAASRGLLALAVYLRSAENGTRPPLVC